MTSIRVQAQAVKDSFGSHALRDLDIGKYATAEQRAVLAAYEEAISALDRPVEKLQAAVGSAAKSIHRNRGELLSFEQTQALLVHIQALRAATEAYRLAINATLYGRKEV